MIHVRCMFFANADAIFFLIVFLLLLFSLSLVLSCRLLTLLALLARLPSRTTFNRRAKLHAIRARRL